MAGRTWVAVALACLVWFGYLKWFAPPPPAPPTQTTQNGEPQTGAATAPAPTPTGAFSVSFPTAPDQTLRNEDMSVGFAPQGAKPLEAEVFSHRRTIQKDAPFMEVLDPERDPFAFATLFTGDTLSTFSSGRFDVAQEGNVLRYTLKEGGVEVRKEYELDPKGHFMTLRIQLTLLAGKTDWGYLNIPLGGRGLTHDAADPLQHWEAVAYQNGSITRRAYDKLSETEEVLQGNTGWVAFGNRYFAIAAINQSTLNPDVVFAKRGDWHGVYLRYPVVLKEGQKTLDYSLRYFIGPKEVSELAQVEGMKGLVDYGTFKIFAYPLLEILRFFYRMFHNYGIAIILLTLLVRALFYPLSLKSYRSMKAMQKIQPQLQALKERYKDDMQRFNQEQIALFRAHKVNPMGGCLPMLVQLPVFFALYTVLSNSIDLFHAPFVGWIQDLSAKDPYYILPILMGISMFAQQKMTPAAGMDPMQQKMMLAMPVIFSFIMLKLPSGLTLYIFLSTLLGIAQQMVINRESQGAGSTVVATSPPGSK